MVANNIKQHIINNKSQKEAKWRLRHSQIHYCGAANTACEQSIQENLDYLPPVQVQPPALLFQLSPASRQIVADERWQ